MRTPTDTPARAAVWRIQSQARFSQIEPGELAGPIGLHQLAETGAQVLGKIALCRTAAEAINKSKAKKAEF